MEIGFYRCVRSTPSEVLPQLAQKALDAGFRISVKARDAEAVERLDEILWTFRADSFLPHAPADGNLLHDEIQPCLIADKFLITNAATLAISMSAGLPPENYGYERALLLFDGNDSEELAAARQHWKALEGREGLTRTYWMQGERGWEEQKT
ncbi:MAG: DNA polymerase III subunit chi [Pacificimonas sp.]|jgi:DNA polymerase-3 subunit chi|nr:DNA polymerase III subunit chi [Pacificimonas sp.]